MTSWKLFAAYFMGITIMLVTAIDKPELDPATQEQKHQPHILQTHQAILFCDDFGATEVRLAKTVTFLTTVVCDTPQVLHIDSDVSVLSHSHINTANMFFVVHGEGKLAFSSKGNISLERSISLERNTATTKPPIITIAGEVILKADGSPSLHVDGGEEDAAQLIRVIDDGHLTSESMLLYTTTSILAGGNSPPSSEVVTHVQPMPPLQDLYLRKALGYFHCKLDSAADVLFPTGGADVCQPDSVFWNFHNTSDNKVNASPSSAATIAAAKDTPVDSEHTTAFAPGILTETGAHSMSSDINPDGVPASFSSPREDANEETTSSKIKDLLHADDLALSPRPSESLSPVENSVAPPPSLSSSADSSTPVLDESRSAPGSRDALADELDDVVPEEVSLSEIDPSVPASDDFSVPDGLIIDDEWSTLTSCDEIFDDVSEAVTNLDLKGSILCEVPRVIEIRPGHHTTLRSAHDLIFQNVFFVVPDNARLSFMAKGAIFMERQEDFISYPIFFLVGGDVTVHAEGGNPRYLAGESVDEHEIVCAFGRSKVLSHQDVKYTETSFAVTALRDAPQEAIRDGDLRDTTYQTLKDIGSALGSEADDVPSSTASAYESFPLEQKRERQHDRQQNQQDQQGQQQNQEGQQQNQEGQQQDQQQQDQQQQGGHEHEHVHEHEHEHEHSPAFGPTAKSTPDTSTARSIHAPNAVRPPFFGPKLARVRPGHPSQDQGMPSRFPNSQDPSPTNHQGGDTLKARWTSKSRTPSTRSESSTPLGTQPPIRNSLKVGEKLSSALNSPDGTSMISMGIDGSIRLSKRAPGTNVDVMVDAGSDIRSTTLVRSDTRSAMEILEARLKSNQETTSDHAAEPYQEGHGPPGAFDPSSVDRWLEANTRPHLAEVEIAVNDRGCVEVTLDKTCVILKAGPHRREWMNRLPWRRRRNDGYELRATGDGLEVTRDERSIWGLTASDLE